MRLKVEKSENEPGQGYPGKLTSLAALLGAAVVAAGEKKKVVFPHPNWFPRTILENYSYLLTSAQYQMLQVAMYGIAVDWEIGEVQLHPAITAVDVEAELEDMYQVLGGEDKLGFPLESITTLLEIGDTEEI